MTVARQVLHALGVNRWRGAGRLLLCLAVAWLAIGVVYPALLMLARLLTVLFLGVAVAAACVFVERSRR